MEIICNKKPNTTEISANLWSANFAKMDSKTYLEFSRTSITERWTSFENIVNTLS